MTAPPSIICESTEHALSLAGKHPGRVWLWPCHATRTVRASFERPPGPDGKLLPRYATKPAAESAYDAAMKHITEPSARRAALRSWAADTLWRGVSCATLAAGLRVIAVTGRITDGVGEMIRTDPTLTHARALATIERHRKRT